MVKVSYCGEDNGGGMSVEDHDRILISEVQSGEKVGAREEITRKKSVSNV